MSWPPVARSSALCHDTIYCIVTQTGKMGSSPFQPLLLIFFFTHFFSFCSTYWKTTKKIYYYYFFHFLVELNKFIKSYFIYFFPVLHTVKPQKKKKSSTHFFFHLILDYLLKISQPPKVLFSPMLLTKHTNHTTQSHITLHSSKCTRNA